MTMAVESVSEINELLKAICLVLKDDGFNVPSQSARNAAESLLELPGEQENKESLSRFATYLLTELGKCFPCAIHKKEWHDPVQKFSGYTRLYFVTVLTLVHQGLSPTKFNRKYAPLRPRHWAPLKYFMRLSSRWRCSFKIPSLT